MMDCKPPILNHSNQHSFNNTSNQLNLTSNIGTYNGKLPLCFGCGKPIVDRFLLQTMGYYYHEDCLKCKICDCRLGEVGSSLFTKFEMLLCKRDYFRLYGKQGTCANCKKEIPGCDFVMKAKVNVYHLECFACQFCNHKFCVGDRFYLHDDKILCEYHYEIIYANGTPNQLVNSDTNNLRLTNTPNH